MKHSAKFIAFVMALSATAATKIIDRASPKLSKDNQTQVDKRKPQAPQAQRHQDTRSRAKAATANRSGTGNAGKGAAAGGSTQNPKAGWDLKTNQSH
jgi:hypothetical protein